MGLMSLSWLWIAIAIAVAFYFFRRNSGANAGGHRTDAPNPPDVPPQVGYDGRAVHGVQTANGANANAPEAAIDPVGGEPLSTARALTSVHQGRIYYFANKENRDRFEASPEQYAGKVEGYAVPGPDAQHQHGHRHGC
jgi:YHS domain-containing protein